VCGRALSAPGAAARASKIDPLPLVDHRDSILVVVDAQEGFFGDHLPAGERERARDALARMTWLAKVARQLDVPAVLTEEDPPRNGPTFGPVADVFPGAEAVAKPTFGLSGTPELVARIEGSGRTTAVLVGFQTDVCVAQSAIGLKERGMRVIVVEDAVFSPGEMHGRGLARMVAEGVELNHCKGLAYEWTRTLERSRSVLQSPEVGDAPFRL
jgi:nicotinamidase-related amidase